MNWLVSSLVAMVCWGVWDLFKLESKYFDWQQTFIVTSIVTLTASLLVFFWLRPSINVHSAGFGYVLSAGILGLVALIDFWGLNRFWKSHYKRALGPLTALYPVVTTFLSYLVLHEEVSLVKGVCIVLALVAILLISLD